MSQATDGEEFTAEQMSTFLRASEGGKARAKALTPEQRSNIAKRAAEKRWERAVPVVHYTGVLDFGETRIDCAVMDDGTRILSQGTVLEALGRAKSMGRRKGAAPFISAKNLEPFISERLLADLQPVAYRVEGNRFPSVGYKASTLPRICEVYLEARAKGALQPNQESAAKAAEILVRGLAQVGITALVDEATGYQEKRAHDELQRLLQAYVDESFRPWVKKFPNEFFKEVYRLYGWHYDASNSKRPQVVGKFINKYIYDQLPDGVLKRLQQVNPKLESGNRSRRHHQHLKDGQGVEHLERQILTVTTLMQVSADIEQFYELFKRRFPDHKLQKTERRVLEISVHEDDSVETLFRMEDFDEKPKPEPL